MNHPVVAALVPVVLLIAVGFFAGKRQWISASAVKDLSNLVFLVLAPALLFRTMASTHGGPLDLRPLAIYFGVALVVYFGVLAFLGLNRRGAVLALSTTFSNTVMIGIPLVGLAYGQRGLFIMFTLVSLHALVLLTVATVVLELAVAREHVPGAHRRPIAYTVFLAVRNAVIHPVPLPIIAGLLYGMTGLGIPEVVDKPLQLLGNAFSPLALVMVGVTLASNPAGAHLRGALALSVVKNVVHPLLMAGAGWLLGLRGVTLAVMVLAASLPMGANVFLFSQRYQVAQETVTASVAVSTILALVTVSAVMLLLGAQG